MHISTSKNYILCKVIYLIQHMLLTVHSKNKLLITFLLPIVNPSSGSFLFPPHAYLTHDLYGFRSCKSSFLNLLSFLKFPQTYSQFSKCYPQPIVTDKKRVEKTSLFLLYPLCTISVFN